MVAAGSQRNRFHQSSPLDLLASKKDGVDFNPHFLSSLSGGRGITLRGFPIRKKNNRSSGLLTTILDDFIKRHVQRQLKIRPP